MTGPRTAALFTALVDDAGVFPPEELEMADALERFRSQRHNPIVTGRFLCPAARLAECLASLKSGEVLSLALITSLEPETLPAALRAAATEPRLALASVEGLRPADPAAIEVAAPGIPVFVELAPGRSLEDDLDLLARHSLRGKLRCGGVRRELFPSAKEVARFVGGCVARGVPFKATAGLHHAIAHHDSRTGFDHHGFLNLTLATARAASGGSLSDVTEVLDLPDRDRLVAETRALTDNQISAIRDHFVCFGSCSTTEPVEDLVALGLLADSPALDSAR